MIEENTEKDIYLNCHGLGWAAIYTGICWRFRGLNFHEHKKMLFDLTEKWMREGLITFSAKDLGGDFSIEEILEHLTSHWPALITDEDDFDLEVYFCMMPMINWLKPAPPEPE